MMEATTIQPKDMKKGDVLGVDVVEAITDAKMGTTAYGLAAMGLCKQIERELEGRGVSASVVVRQGNICVLSDEDAEIHEKRQFARHVNGMERAVAKHQQIDVAQLSHDSKHAHDRDGEVMSLVYQAAKSVAELPRLLAGAHRRSVPGLPAE
jgi:hypothetical protein